MFKKFLMVMGAIFLLLIFIVLLLWGIGFIYNRTIAKDINAESKAYANDTIVAITASWDAQQLISRGHPSLFSKSPPDQIRGVFSRLQAIGRVKQFNGCIGQAQVHNDLISFSQYVTADYRCPMEFDNAMATIDLRLVKERGKNWKINSMLFNSPFFENNNQAQQP